MTEPRRNILLLQLPIPPLGPEPIKGNVPLAAGYLQMYATQQGLASAYNFQIFPPMLANRLGDSELVDAILEREPWLVGFTCYLWNIERTLWLAERLKEAAPGLRIILGGPEITADNDWVLESPCVDYAAIGEGEQTFAELLTELLLHPEPSQPIDGLFVRPERLPPLQPTLTVKGRSGKGRELPLLTEANGSCGSHQPITISALPKPAFRKPLAQLDVISSPYLAGILDAADEKMLLLETLRGCVFKCKFCYYPKSYDDLYHVSEVKIIANLEHARQRGAKEVVLLDPTLNQGRNFHDFLRLLIRCNPERQFTFFGELRAEGITQETAQLLRLANFTEVEVGLQSIDPHAMHLMDRKNNLKAVERGIRAMRAEGIKVKVDLIIGLPGDTVDSVRRSFAYLKEKALYDDVQVFNLAILPGTAFRQEAEQLGLLFQPRPPYYVLRTPTLQTEDLFMLMEEAQAVFDMEWDPLPPPELPDVAGLHHGDAVTDAMGLAVAQLIDLEQTAKVRLPEQKAQVFTLWFRGENLKRRQRLIERTILRLLTENPFTTLQVVLEPTGSVRTLKPSLLDDLWAACLTHPTYLDRYYTMQPGHAIGAKRLVLLLPSAERPRLGDDWIEAMSEQASLVWHGSLTQKEELGAGEFMLAQH
jgi:radical SAM superfamily enzyme YgiQ (UPF0313 family)